MTVSLQQDEFVRRIFEPQIAPHKEQTAYELYQKNLIATARRALNISYPTVNQLVGDELFNHVADELLRKHPPNNPDWGEWGAEFASALEMTPQLEDYPYIPDCAQLDSLLHQAERAEDTQFKPNTLALLESECLNRIGIGFSPSSYVMRTPYPIIEIFGSHKEDGQDALNRAKKLLQQEDFQQYILVYRPKFKAQIMRLTRAEHDWIKSVLAGNSIGHSLDAIEGQTFDFAAWLPKLVHNNIITHLNCTA